MVISPGKYPGKLLNQNLYMDLLFLGFRFDKIFILVKITSALETSVKLSYKPGIKMANKKISEAKNS